MSDLHLESSNFDLHASIDRGILLLIGDISADFTMLDAFFRKLNPEVKAVYVPGNHEFEGKKFDEVVPFLKDLLTIYPNVTVLDNESVIIDGIKIIGSTLWTNFDIADYFVRRDILKRCDEIMPDFLKVRILDNGVYRRYTVQDSIRQFDKAVQYLEYELTRNRVNMPTVVATHFAPSKLSAHPKFEKDAMNAYWVNQIDHLVKLADYWFHGHTHETMEYKLDECFVGCNPRGTAHMLNLAQNALFDVNRHIVIDTAE